MFAWRRATGERETCWRKRGASLVSGMIGCRVICLLLVCGRTVRRNYVSVPCGFAQPRWEVRLRGAVPVGSAKHAGVNAACRW